MTCEIWVGAVKNGFAAMVLGLSGCAVEAPTRAEAIEKARHYARRLLTGGEIVRVEVEVPEQAKARGVGIFADEDEESCNSFLAAMKEHRQQVDADPNEF